MVENSTFPAGRDAPAATAPLTSRAALIVASLLVAYVAALFIFDWRTGNFTRLPELAAALVITAAMSALSFGVRYLRWRWLLQQSAVSVPFWTGFLAYLTGFALTISPGKAGELIRIRYFARMGVSAQTTIACFTVERILDLVVLLALASLMVRPGPSLAIAALFVAAVIATVVILARFRRARAYLELALRRRNAKGAGRALYTLGRGLERAIDLLTPRAIAVGLLFGIPAWSLQAVGFVALLSWLAIEIPWSAAFPILPAAMLIGAASMIPGGVGSTEAATALMLTNHGVALDAAILASVGVRLATLWLSIVLGFIAIGVLELRALPVQQSSKS